MIRTAVVLAAGMGVRLAERGRVRPKGFLEVGALPIVEESLLKLVQVGVERVVFVTGHESGWYEALARRYPRLVHLVHNERFAVAGSLASLCRARAHVDEDFLLLESDLVYERRGLERLLADPRPDGLLVSGPTRAGDEIWIEAKGGELVDMSKDRTTLTGEIAGELVGITKLSRGLFAEVLAYADAELPGEPGLAYETDGLVCAARRHPLPCALVADLAWGEIDFESHLERVQREVYPVTRLDLEGDALAEARVCAGWMGEPAPGSSLGRDSSAGA